MWLALSVVMAVMAVLMGVGIERVNAAVTDPVLRTSQWPTVVMLLLAGSCFAAWVTS